MICNVFYWPIKTDVLFFLRTGLILVHVGDGVRGRVGRVGGWVTDLWRRGSAVGLWSKPETSALGWKDEGSGALSPSECVLLGTCIEDGDRRQSRKGRTGSSTCCHLRESVGSSSRTRHGQASEGEQQERLGEGPVPPGLVEGGGCMHGGGPGGDRPQIKGTSCPYSFFPCGFHSVAVLIPA